MDAKKIINDAEKRLEVKHQNEIAVNWIKENRIKMGLPPDLPAGMTKGPFIRALCKKLRELIPDDECIELDLENPEYGPAEVDGLDIAIHLLLLTKDIPDDAPVYGIGPCDDDPDYLESRDDEILALKQLQIKLPIGW
jgi:hypothetical protein